MGDELRRRLVAVASRSAPTSDWIRYCESNACIETRQVGEKVEIRSTRRPDVVLSFDQDEWKQFLAGVRGEG